MNNWPPFTIEKDVWVTLVLRMLFASELSEQIVFKGGIDETFGDTEFVEEPFDVKAIVHFAEN